MSGILKPKAILVSRVTDVHGSLVNISPPLGSVWWFKGSRYTMARTAGPAGSQSRLELRSVNRASGQTNLLKSWDFGGAGGAPTYHAGELTEIGTVASYDQYLQVYYHTFGDTGLTLSYAFHFLGLEGAISSL